MNYIRYSRAGTRLGNGQQESERAFLQSAVKKFQVRPVTTFVSTGANIHECGKKVGVKCIKFTEKDGSPFEKVLLLSSDKKYISWGLDMGSKQRNFNVGVSSQVGSCRPLMTLVCI